MNPFGEAATQTHGNAGQPDQQRAIAEAGGNDDRPHEPAQPDRGHGSHSELHTLPVCQCRRLHVRQGRGPSPAPASSWPRRWRSKRGNISSGFSELSRGANPDGSGYSEILKAFAWDPKTNTERPLQAPRHWIDSKSGGRKTRDEREIYELVANMAQRARLHPINHPR